MPRSQKPSAQTRRFATDHRCESQLAWLQKVGVLAFGGRRPPSHSQIIRRAVGLLTKHVTMQIESGRQRGLSGPAPNDAAAERAALEDHGRIVEAAAPNQLVDPEGRLQGWQEAILSEGFKISPNLGLEITPTEKADG